ncbi:MAG: glycosyltransferase family 39 protein [Gemmatimonadota bacterium]|nr:glycosyltransferase family 39 protein [Gemmatimonadota bacterium]
MTSTGSTAPSRLRSAAIAAPLAVFAIALAARLVGLHHTPYVDELNHVMAAHSLLERGTLELTPGGEPYTRARLFTWLVAALFRVFGESLAVARIPAVIAGAALVTALFAFVRSAAGRAAAWTAAMLFCFQPESLYLSELARFYTIQTLCFFGGAVFVYRAVTTPALSLARLAQLAVGALLLFLLALHLQVITIVGIAGVLAWALLDRARATLSRSHIPAALAALVIVAAIGLFALHRGLFANQLALFTYVDQWAAQNRHNVRFYHEIFLDQYATLWTLFPLLALLAIKRNARAALFALIPFVVAFVAHSLAAWKAERYLFSVMPLFFAIAGMGIAEGAARVRPALTSVVDSTLDWLAGRATTPRARQISLALLATVIAAFALIGNGATSYAIKMLRTSDADWQLALLYRGEPDWDAAHATLAPAADSAAVVISSSELKSLYYLHRADVLLGVGYLDSPRKPEYFIFRKLARPVVSTVASLEELRACYPTGLVVAEHGQWRTPWSIQPAVADYIAATMDSVPLAPQTRLMAWRWRTPVADSAANCATIQAIVHR